MTEKKLTQVPEGFLLEEHKKGCMLLREKYLDKLPNDWHDCIMFIDTQGLHKELNSPHVIILNDEESTRIFKLLAENQIKCYIVPSGDLMKAPIWEVALLKNMPDEVNKLTDPERIIMGGECFREFCDARNLYYKSILVDNKLLSSSDMRWEKKPGEDCRIPEKTMTQEDVINEEKNA